MLKCKRGLMAVFISILFSRAMCLGASAAGTDAPPAAQGALLFAMALILVSSLLLFCMMLWAIIPRKDDELVPIAHWREKRRR